jgi:hypothetical protein
VVVIAGPAQRGTATWVKLAAVMGLVATIGLGGTLVYVLLRKPAPAKPETAEAGSRRVVDTPIAVADPGSTTGKTAVPADPKRAAPAPAKRPPPRPATQAKAAPAQPGLSGSQRALSSIYADDGDKAQPHGVDAPAHPGGGGGGRVSESAIMSVVTQNKRSLNLCYDRVLKHDSTLKRARVPAHVKIGISGRVVQVSIPDPTYANTEIGQCIVQSIKRWNFPGSDAEYETEFPILLQAD